MTSSSFTPKTQCQQKGQLKIGASLAMRQALQVLQMPIGELKTWLNQVITQNPFLEWQEEPPLDLSEDKKIHYSHSLINIPDKPSLFSYLMTQARLIFTDKHLLKIAEWIIGNLEPTGFFPLSSIESSFSFDVKEIFLCLEKIKEFDPPGIGAKDVQESFLLQLKALKKENSLTFMIISDDFDALLSKKFSFLQKKYLINEQNMQKVLLEDIAILDPFPGYRFLPSSPLSLPVDIIFIPEEGST
ncbi:MAG: hypothetical protein JSS09_07105, partial [Verrucomicrobia bacterium]|nr:hypothetical protein [Verrucomicrobiota bacterium]